MLNFSKFHPVKMGFDLGKGVRSSGMSFLKDPMGYGAMDDALAAQTSAVGRANSTLGSLYRQQRKDLQPWQRAGEVALSGLANPDFQRDFTAADFEKDPGYDFRLQEGERAISRAAAAGGGRYSGSTLKSLAKYGQDYSSGEFQNAYDRFNADRDRRFTRLSSLAGMGQNATGQLVGAAGDYGARYSENQLGIGNAYAARGMARANANQGMLSGLLTLGAKSYGGGA